MGDLSMRGYLGTKSQRWKLFIGIIDLNNFTNILNSLSVLIGRLQRRQVMQRSGITEKKSKHLIEKKVQVVSNEIDTLFLQFKSHKNLTTDLRI